MTMITTGSTGHAIDNEEWAEPVFGRPEWIADTVTRCAEILHTCADRSPVSPNRITAATDYLLYLAEHLRTDAENPDDLDDAHLYELAGDRFRVVRHDNNTANPFVPPGLSYALFESNGCEVGRGLTYTEAIEIVEYWPDQRTGTIIPPTIVVEYAPRAGVISNPKQAPILRFDATKIPRRIGTHTVWRSRGWTLLLAEGDVHYLGGHLKEVEEAVWLAETYLSHRAYENRCTADPVVADRVQDNNNR